MAFAVREVVRAKRRGGVSEGAVQFGKGAVRSCVRAHFCIPTPKQQSTTTQCIASRHAHAHVYVPVHAKAEQPELLLLPPFQT
jgi:hypothetical protein